MTGRTRFISYAVIAFGVIVTMWVLIHGQPRPSSRSTLSGRGSASGQLRLAALRQIALVLLPAVFEELGCSHPDADLLDRPRDIEKAVCKPEPGTRPPAHD
jgi:hypothetical protein